MWLANIRLGLKRDMRSPPEKKAIFMEKPMPILEVTELLRKCYISAEESSRGLLATDYLDKGEGFITELFHGRLRAAVSEANKNGLIKTAFINDLGHRFPDLRRSSDLNLIATGIRASTTLHPREVEAKTGGDFGIVLVRPSISESRYNQYVLKINRNYQRGLLCQAKLKRRRVGADPPIGGH